MLNWLTSSDATTTPLPERPVRLLLLLLIVPVLVLDRLLDDGRELDAEETRLVLGVGPGLPSRPTNLRAESTGVGSVSKEGATTTLLSTRRSCSRGTSQALSPPPLPPPRPTPVPSLAVNTFPDLAPPRAPLRSGRRTTDGRDAREVADDAGRSPPAHDHGIAPGSPPPRRPERIVVAFEVVSSHLPSGKPKLLLLVRPFPRPFMPLVRPVSPRPPLGPFPLPR